MMRELALVARWAKDFIERHGILRGEADRPILAEPPGAGAGSLLARRLCFPGRHHLLPLRTISGLLLFFLLRAAPEIANSRWADLSSRATPVSRSRLERPPLPFPGGSSGRRVRARSRRRLIWYHIQGFMKKSTKHMGHRLGCGVPRKPSISHPRCRRGLLRHTGCPQPRRKAENFSFAGKYPPHHRYRPFAREESLPGGQRHLPHKDFPKPLEPRPPSWSAASTASYPDMAILDYFRKKGLKTHFTSAPWPLLQQRRARLFQGPDLARGAAPADHARSRADVQEQKGVEIDLLPAAVLRDEPEPALLHVVPLRRGNSAAGAAPVHLPVGPLPPRR